MKILFNKYEGTGNDFIIIDNRKGIIKHDDHKLIGFLCDRRFGIGADGLILAEDEPGYDFRMVFFNSDGFPATMCGNGARCISDFVMRKITGRRKLNFLAPDGPHTSIPECDLINVTINDVKGIKETVHGVFLNTGVPHLVCFSNDIMKKDLIAEARPIRYSPVYGSDGTNVNMAEISDRILHVRTYERGVEDETYSCGTGVTASAIAAVATGRIEKPDVDIMVKGGRLNVKFILTPDGAREIHLTGPAKFVFEGEIEI
ncbi:MAG TPA: diaminopimelate epimerase [Bacteroidales bacterium]|nr:diaminopimelate epimerase [Bacteroidales bacterium]